MKRSGDGRGSARQVGITAWALTVLACSGSPTAPRTPTGQFDAFWRTFDEVYPYFEHKAVDWDALRSQHRPRAESAADTEELVDILLEMTAPLKDLHVAFTSPEGERIPTYVPDAFVNWDRDVWLALVGELDWTQVKPNLGHARVSGVPYVVIGAWNPEQFSSADFDSILDEYRNDPVLVLDVRPNGGGVDSLALNVAGRFTASPVFIESVQYRNGPEHDDFGPRQNRTLQPRGPWRYEGDVYLLVGRGVFSSNETFVSAMRELSGVTLVGDTTGGASANPARHELGGGWSYTVSRWIARTPDDIVIEGNGIPPDVVVPASEADFAQGRDPVLEWAVAAGSG